MVNTLGDCKSSHRVSEFYGDKDLKSIFDEAVTADELNDCVLTRAIDKMNEAGCQNEG